MGSMAKDVIHVSDKEAASDFASLLARVREGAEVVIEHDARPVAVVRPAEAFRGRLLSESIALAKAHATSLLTSKKSLTAIVSRSARLHGIDPRFQLTHRR